MEANATAGHHAPWNKRNIVGQKAPLKLKDIWALRVRLQMANRAGALAAHGARAERQKVAQKEKQPRDRNL